jgi:hypothetical protein
MEELSKDVLHFLLDISSLPDISSLSQTCRLIYSKVMKYKSMKTGRKCFLEGLDANITLVYAANNNDLKLAKHLVEYKQANDWKRACDNCRSENKVFKYLHKLFDPVNIRELNIKKFDMMENINITSNNINIIGNRGCHKTQIVKDILHTIGDIKIKRVMILTTDELKWQECCDIIGRDKCVIISEKHDENIELFWESQKKIIRNDIENIYKHKALIILDGVLYINNSRIFNDIVGNNRHYSTNIINININPPLYSPSVRCNFDYIFMFYDANFSNRKELFSHYGGVFPTFNEFCEVFDFLTENNRCLVVNQRSLGYNIEDIIYWYKSPSRKVNNMKLNDNDMKSNNKELKIL